MASETNPVAVCHLHGGTAADGVCAECRGLFCWACLGYAPDADEFVCTACAGLRQVRERRRRFWRFLRMPFFYVVLAVCGAVAAFALGVGNEAPWRLQLLDRGRPWHRQQLPLAWLGQARRCWQRADWLFLKGRDAEGRTAALTAQRAFHAAAELWRDTPVGRDLALAAAVLRGRAGLGQEARADLAALAPQFGDGLAKAELLYDYGLVAHWNGDAATARTNWREALAALGNIQGNDEAVVGGVIAQLAGSVMPASGEDAVRQWVRTVCRNSADPAELAGRVRLAAQRAKIELRDAQPHGTVPAVPGERRPAVGAPESGIRIERFQ